MNALDELDPRRFDSEAICDRLNEFAELSDAEQDEYLGAWEYAGLEEAGHVLGALLPEAHNATYVVRDLDGTMRLLWEEPPSRTWHNGPLYDGHIAVDGELSEVVEEQGIDVNVAVLIRAARELPAAPIPVRSY